MEEVVLQGAREPPAVPMPVSRLPPVPEVCDVIVHSSDCTASWHIQVRCWVHGCPGDGKHDEVSELAQLCLYPLGLSRPTGHTTDCTSKEPHGPTCGPTNCFSPSYGEKFQGLPHPCSLSWSPP